MNRYSRSNGFSHSRFLCSRTVALVIVASMTLLIPTSSFTPQSHMNMRTRRQHQQQQQNQFVRHSSEPQLSSTRSRKPSSTSLQMAFTVPTGVVAVAGAISGGLFAGGLHAIAGTLRCCIMFVLEYLYYVTFRSLLCFVACLTKKPCTNDDSSLESQ